MTNDDESLRFAASPGAARALSLRAARPQLAGALENDTPDATRGCRADGPQSQARCGLAVTTAAHEADHPATTSAATH
jgi:hypothetical protein